MVSVVIPTYKRSESLNRLLKSIQAQTMKPTEVIIVSGEKESLNETLILDQFKDLTPTIIYTKASVCVQRNSGIKLAQSEFTFLCDDDIEPEPKYIETLVEYLKSNPERPQACGLFLEKNEGKWTSNYAPRSFKSLIFKYIFLHSIWGSIDELVNERSSNPIKKRMYSFYKTIGNTFTKAGWPIVTDLSQKVNSCQFYSLGASIFRSEILRNHLFDENLDPSGYGDNYGVSLSLGTKPIRVLNNTFVHHHKESVNRSSAHKAYYKRTLAMSYFLQKEQKFRISTRIYLIWSVFGNLLGSLVHMNINMAFSSIRVIVALVVGHNPYLSKKQ